MATLATFWQFSKRINSTLLPPSDLEKEEWFVIFKQPSSILSLTLECHNENVKRMNYVHIPLYERYYFIRDVETIANETYILHCEVDVLGTFGGQVLGQSIYMNYSSYGYDVQLNDTRVQPTVGYNYHIAGGDLGLFDASATLYECVAVICKDGELNGVSIFQGKGIAKTYINSLMVLSDIKSLLTDLSGQDMFAPLVGVWLTPFEFTKCVNNTAVTNHEVWNKSIGGRAIQDLKLNSWDLDILVPQSKYTDFRRSSQYLQYSLYLPFVGVIDLPVQYMVDATHLIIRYCADPISGDITYNLRIHGALNKVAYGQLGDYTGHCKIEVPIGKVQSQGARMMAALGVGALSIATGTAHGLVTGGAVGGLGGIALGTAAAAASTFATSVTQPKYSNISQYGGGLGSLAAITAGAFNPILILAESDSTAEPSSYTAYSGRPCQRVQAIKNGYVQSSQPSVTFAGKLEEIEAFNNALRSGVYFE